MKIEEGIKIQQEQIDEMATYLKPEVIRDLRVEAGVRNAMIDLTKNGYQVWRGCNLLTWVQNNRHRWAV
jgi:hypothetical protein